MLTRQDQYRDAGCHAAESQRAGQLATRAIREDSPTHLGPDADQADGAADGGRRHRRHPMIHQVGDLVDHQHLRREVPREIDGRDPPETPGSRGGRQGPMGVEAGRGPCSIGRGLGCSEPGRIPDQPERGGKQPADGQRRLHPEGPLPAPAIDHDLRQRDQAQDPDPDPGRGHTHGGAEAPGEPSLNQDDGRHPSGQADPHGGESGERQVQMPPRPRLRGEGEADSHHDAARQEETPRAVPTRHPADERTQAAMDEDEERKGAGDQRAAPAELPGPAQPETPSRSTRPRR